MSNPPAGDKQSTQYCLVLSTLPSQRGFNFTPWVCQVSYFVCACCSLFLFFLYFCSDLFEKMLLCPPPPICLYFPDLSTCKSESQSLLRRDTKALRLNNSPQPSAFCRKLESDCVYVDNFTQSTYWQIGLGLQRSWGSSPDLLKSWESGYIMLKGLVCFLHRLAVVRRLELFVSTFDLMGVGHILIWGFNSRD